MKSFGLLGRRLRIVHLLAVFCGVLGLTTHAWSDEISVDREALQARVQALREAFPAVDVTQNESQPHEQWGNWGNWGNWNNWNNWANWGNWFNR